MLFISSKCIVKAVSVLLTLFFLFGTTLCARANDSMDIYGINLGAQVTDDKPNVLPFSAMENATEIKPAFALHADKVTADSAEISWESNRLFLNYTVKKWNRTARVWEEQLSTVEPHAVVQGLMENTEYTFAVFGGMAGEMLGSITLATGMYQAGVSVAHYSSGEVTLQISYPEDASKVVLYRSENEGTFHKIAEVTESTYTDTDVQEETKYTYIVTYFSVRGGAVSRSESSKRVSVVTMKSFGLPAVSGETKTYAYYTAVKARRSPQYRLLRSEACYTDEATGIRMVDGFYCVALGSYYGTTIGTKYRITLEGGKELNVILCDQKSDRHTDEHHQYARRNQDIVEFYVEKSKLPKGIRGDFSRLEQFSGKVIAIEQYIEE